MILNKISSFLSGIIGNINKSEAELDFQNSMEAIDDLFQAFSQTSDIVGFATGVNLKSVKLIADLKKDTENNKIGLLRPFDSPHGARGMSFVIYCLNNMKLNGETVAKHIKAIDSNIILVDTIKVLQANVLRAITHYDFLSKYISDLLVYVSDEEICTTLKVESKLPPKMIENLYTNSKVASVLLGTYALPPKEFDKLIANLYTGFVSKDKEDSINAYIQDLNKVDITPSLPSGFAGNPIYILRGMSIIKQTNKYRRNKDTKQLLLLRLNYYDNIIKTGQADASVEKEILWLQNQVITLDRAIAKAEEGIK